jgi:hypothetical protein
MRILFRCLLWLCFPGITLVYLSGCKKAESIQAYTPKPEAELRTQERIIHLYSDTVYILSTPLVRNAGEQLVIDAGTLIKVNVDASGQANPITINAGGVIIANGTSANPIIFTSNELTGNQYLNWGGITINGNSINNSTRPNGDPADFSGSLNYVRIEFASLTLNAVGNRSIIENIQVSYANPRSSIQIRGGTFNTRYLVSYASGGPADFFITEGYAGNMQHLLAYRHPFFGSRGTNPINALTGVFIENNTSNPVNARPYTYPVISNLTVIGPNAQNGSPAFYGDTTSLPFRSAALVTTGSTCFRIRNSIILAFPAAAWYLDDSLTAGTVRYNQSEVSYSMLHSNNANRIFYLEPGKYKPFNSLDFKNFMLSSQFRNQVLTRVDDFMLEDPFNYDRPNLFPKDSAAVLKGANFDGPAYSNPYFVKVPHIGAIGNDNWMLGWTNFVPLKTDYNVPR